MAQFCIPALSSECYFDVSHPPALPLFRQMNDPEPISPERTWVRRLASWRVSERVTDTPLKGWRTADIALKGSCASVTGHGNRSGKTREAIVSFGSAKQGGRSHQVHRPCRPAGPVPPLDRAGDPWFSRQESAGDLAPSAKWSRNDEVLIHDHRYHHPEGGLDVEVPPPPWQSARPEHSRASRRTPSNHTRTCNKLRLVNWFTGEVR